MTSSTKNVKLGVCSVTFKGVDLGYTKGGVDVSVKTTTKQVQIDQFGNSTINEYIIGRECTAKVPLAETTLDNMARIMPGSTLIAAGGAKATGTVTFATAAPQNLDFVSVNGVKFTFKTAPAGPNDLAIPGTVGAAATALATAINASIDPKVVIVSAVAALGVVTITADDMGVDGNAITLAVSGANITASGAALASGADPTSKKISVPNGIGISLLTQAGALVLHPIANDPTDRSEDFVIPLAMTPGEVDFSFKLDAERIFNCTFTAYPDSITRELFYVGWLLNLLPFS